MKKFLEKLIPHTTKPDMFLGFSGTSLKWIVSSGIKDTHGRIRITAAGTIAHIGTKNKKTLPKDFISYVASANIQYVLPVGTCTHTLTTQQVDMAQVHAEAPGFVVTQKSLASTRGTDIYQTTSVYIEQVKHDINVLHRLGVVPTSVYHVAHGMSFRDNHLRNPATIIVYLGEVSSWVSWVVNGDILYQQDIMIGTDILVKTISELVHVSYDDAKNILQKYGITRSHPQVDVFVKLMDILEPITKTIQLWINDYAQYTYMPKTYSSHPGIIYVYGPGATIPGIEQYFVLQTGISVENISEKILQDYILDGDTHRDALIPYESLIIQVHSSE